MLPSSHPVLIDAALADEPSATAAAGQFSGMQIEGFFDAREGASDSAQSKSGKTGMLVSAFSEFILASSRLENSYRQLQQEVYELGLELSDRNAALNISLAENERMRIALQQILDSMPCGILVLGCGGTISMINPECGRLLGVDVAKFLAAPDATLKQLSVLSGVNLQSSYEDRSNGEAEREYCVNDGAGKRWLAVRNRSLRQQSGESEDSDRTILIVRDVTAQKRAEQEREAGRRAMALAEVATILAHEIRNPLASLELFAELIEKDAERSDEWISNLRAGIRSLSGTVNNVLSFHGTRSLKLTPLRLSDLIDSAIEFVQPVARQASVLLEWHGIQEGAIVKANAGALQQVVLNLASNAIRHTPAGGTVHVSLRTECREVTSDCASPSDREIAVVEFADTGCGIRPDQIDRIFEPGFSGSGDTSGLGLAVCERIMKQHGGRIFAANQNGSGARFTLQFPVSQLEMVTT
jgi:two-component system sensor histidine kinase FlrB